MSDSTLPAELAGIREDFLALEQRERLQLLLEFSNSLPDLPERYADHPDLLERVEECQSPVFIFVEVDDASAGLKDLTVDEVLSVPADYPLTIGLTEAVSPLRIRGMMALLGRIQRQVREKAKTVVE
jgi:cysteine desulfuration protein SufE